MNPKTDRQIDDYRGNPSENLPKIQNYIFSMNSYSASVLW